MLHEILLSLSGHPSPLLRDDYSDASARSLLSAPERELLRTARDLSELHCNLINHTTQITASHPSIICRAVSTAISSIQLSAFQRKILEVEDSILRKDAGLVGAYNIVPLTAVVGEFSGWTRTLRWLWELLQFISKKSETGAVCTGADLMNKLRSEMQTGYADIIDTTLTLIQAAETAWLKQMSAWVLYGRLPSFGAEDFFICKNGDAETGYDIDPKLLPSFVTSSCASSMLFIGTSLIRVQAMNIGQSTVGELGHLSSQLEELSRLSFPLSSAGLSRAVTAIRLNLSRTILQELLPLDKVVDMLKVLRQFMLVGRGEFAMALTQQADERIRGRWRRADNPAYLRRDNLGTIAVKEGEAAAVLNRTWAALGTMQGEHAEDDEELEIARDVLHLSLPGSQIDANKTKGALVDTPFRNLLLSSPVELIIRIPSPLDLFLSYDDTRIYTCINSYLLSIRRAHLRLTDLWKVTRLRRHHRAPPRAPFSMTRAGINKTEVLRERWAIRSLRLRSTWTTSSAAIFFLAEVEAFLQIEIVEELWADFHSWLTQEHAPNRSNGGGQPGSRSTSTHNRPVILGNKDSTQEHVTAGPVNTGKVYTHSKIANHDPQTLAIAHRLYLQCLTKRLLLTQANFTEPVYNLLIYADHLVALIHRLDGIWSSMDLESDEGVVDAFSNSEAEEADIGSKLAELEIKIKRGVEEVVQVLRSLSMDATFLATMEEDGTGNDGFQNTEENGQYIPKRTGSIHRLLMKLDFGGWFDSGPAGSGTIAEDDV